MAKRKVKTKTETELAEIEADRIAASDRTGPYAVDAKEEAELDAISDGIDRIHAELDEKEAIEGRLEELDGMEEALEDKVPNSVVKDKFKNRYAENAAIIGDKRKQVKRSNWDWLAQMLAAFCLNEKGKIDIGSFKDVLDANGVDHSRWTNRNKGWEGRFRMTGRVALQRVVANSGVLKWPGGLEDSVAPSEWAKKYKAK